MASKKEIDYNYYNRVIRKVFPEYRFDPQLLQKPNTEFVIDIMRLFVDYYLNVWNWNSHFPAELIQISESPSARSLSTWGLLANCNALLSRFDIEVQLFTVNDMVCPNHNTAQKIVVVLALCVNICNLDMTETFEHIKETLNKQTYVEDSEKLTIKNRELKVTNECLVHKLDTLKRRKAIEHVDSAEAAKVDAHASQQRSLLLQLESDEETILESIKIMEENLVDDNLVETLKSQLQSLELKNQTLSSEMEDLKTNTKTTIVAEQLLEFHLCKMNTVEETVKQYENYVKVEKDLATEIQHQRRRNADLIREIECIRDSTKLNNEEVNLKEAKHRFRRNKAKLEAELVAEAKTIEELKRDFNEESSKFERVCDDVESKCNRIDSLTETIKETDKEAKETLNTMLQETLKKLDRKSVV